MLMACSMLLAGCIDMSDDEVEEILDEIIEIPGCNDETALNYDETATNSLACLTEIILKQSVTDFVNLINDGPQWGDTVGLKMEGTEVDSDGERTSFTTTSAMSLNGMYVHIHMDMGMVDFETSELLTENPDGTTNIVTNWMGNSYQMNSYRPFDDVWNAQTFAENQDDDDSDGGSDDEFDMGLPDTDVSLPEDFDPATALYAAGLATGNGYSFTTTVDSADGYSTVMTFMLSPDFQVTKLTMEETDMDGMVATSSITVLDAATIDQLLTSETTLIEHALPFTVEPMGGMDDYDDEYDDHDDHGDHHDDIDWEPYEGGYCEWEGNPDDDSDVWSCKDDESDDEWDTWWYYCELHGDDWFCTDDLGQDPEYENSADNSQYGQTGDGHDDHNDHDDHDDHDDHNDDDVFFDAYLTDNYASSEDQYVDPEFTIYSGFDILVEIDFELLDSDGNQITSLMIYPQDFTETSDGYMMYYFPLDYDTLADGCYTLTAEVATSTDDYHQYERFDICINPVDDHGDDDHGDHMSTDDYLQMMDQDEDGMVSWDEFEDFIINHDGGWADDQDRSDTYDHFNYTDDNADGYLDYDEFSNWIDSIDIGHGDDDGHDDGDNYDDGDGMMSEEDFFAAADSDNDGYVSVQDIIDVAMAGDAPTPQEALDDGDADNSDGISWDEFVSLWNEDEDDDDDQHLDNNAELRSALHDAFNNSDTDSNGELSIDELQAFIDEAITLASADEDDDDVAEFTNMIGLIANCMDEDGDGLLDQMEFSEFYMVLESDGDSIIMMFCMFDTDGNELVTASEYADYMNQSGYYDEEPMSDEEWNNFVSMLSYYDTDDIEGLDIVEFEYMMMGMSDDGDDDHDDHNDDDDDYDDYETSYDWIIDSADMMTTDDIAGSFADYYIVLASCTMDNGPDEDGNMDPTDMMDTNAMTCGEDVMKISVSEAFSSGTDIMFHDADTSGTVTQGDMIHINPDSMIVGDWNMVRLYSEPADKYSDENPMLPGFGAVAGIIALLGAALLTRRTD